MALMQWVQHQPKIRDHMLSIPNEGKRSHHVGKRLKRMGMMAGASDLFLAFPVSPYSGLFLELKRREKSRTTPEQLGFQERMTRVGYKCVIAMGWDEAREAIEEYMAAGGSCKSNSVS